MEHFINIMEIDEIFHKYNMEIDGIFHKKMEIDETFQMYHVNCLWNFLKKTFYS